MLNSQNNPSVLPEIFDHNICECGESPLWHPLRQQLYWVDITTQTLLTHVDGQTQSISFDEFVTALAWIDSDTLLAATETALVQVNLNTFEKTPLYPLEADNPKTRSNDGRADPWGGFWISTMGKAAEKNAGKIYRYFEGAFTTVIDAITIPNAICFDKSRNCAYFADTAVQHLYRVSLDDKTGMPNAAPQIFVDFSKANLSIDGSIVDQDGNLWIGVWDGEALLKLSPHGEIIDRLPTGASRPTCAAFGGPDYTDLFITSAAIGLHDTLSAIPQQGKTLIYKGFARGQAEPNFKMQTLNC